MSGWETDPAPEETTVSIDAYGIKMKARLSDIDEPAPTSWKDVIKQLRLHLLRIAVAPTRLVAEVLEGATRIVRGISRVPTAVAERIGQAHRQADDVERKRQNELASGMRRNLPASSDTVERIYAILEKYRALGRDAYIVFGPDETIVVVMGTPPDSQEMIEEAVEHFQLPKPTEKMSGE